jgi:hypothetical protein
MLQYICAVVTLLLLIGARLALNSTGRLPTRSERPPGLRDR